MRNTTLCYLEREDEVLLLHRVKKDRDENAGKWIGVGGHFLEGESPDDCVLRETKEETGLTLTSYALRGIVTFVSDEWGTEYMFLYTADGFEGDLIPCDEGDLQWVKKDKVLSLPLWEGDRLFFALLAGGEPFFSLKLCYRGDDLVQAVLNGKELQK